MKIFNIVNIFIFIFFGITLDGKEIRLEPEAAAVALVHGCVNVVTGEFVQHDTDLVIDTPSSLFHSRAYNSGNSNVASALGHGFTWAIPRKIQLVQLYPKAGKDDEGNLIQAGTSTISVEEREGVPLIYQKDYDGADGQEYAIRASVLSFGYTNYNPWGLSGATSLHNVVPLHQDAKEDHSGGMFTVTLGCGTKRIYNGKVGKRQWLLAEEVRPDGCRVFYDYDEEANLRKVWLTGAEESTPIASYVLNRDGNAIYVEGSNGQKVRYTTNTIKTNVANQKRLIRVEGAHLPKTEYSYGEKDLSAQTLGLILHVVRPEGRRLGIGYYANGQVSALFEPATSGSGFVKVATFSYGEGVCEVAGLCGELARYHTDSHKRISHIGHYAQNKLYKQLRYFWATEGKQCGNLLATALCAPTGEALSSSYLVYDEQGNVTKETLLGNLSGVGSATHFLHTLGESQGDAESYSIERSYLPAFNVVTEEKGLDGAYTCYRYKEGTNLLIARLRGQPKYFSREFFAYDQYANRICQIVDDGSGNEADDWTDVTVRIITEIEPVITPLSAAFGKPAKKCEKYWEAGQEHPLRTIRYQYDQYGYPTQEDHFDAEGKHRYSIQRTYDAAGRVLEETDPIGQKTIHSYDLNGNCIRTYLQDQEISFEYLYDCRNRLIKESEIHPHARYETSHLYDLSSRKIATEDQFGNKTLYAYDELGRLITTTQSPANGALSKERYEYDVADNKIVVEDISGGVTRTTYTARNQPIQISYPDGSQESYRYNMDGTVAEHTALDGTKTVIYYDSCRRPIKKCLEDEQGNYLCETSTTYQGSRIIAEIDAKGGVTRYEYDGAGRLTATIQGDRCTQYAYDSLGRQYKTIEWADDSCARITIHEYDLLDRLIEERVEDRVRKLYNRHQYFYDSKGNCCLHLTENSQGLVQTKTDYDSRHRPVRRVDALGNVTVINYEENFAQGFLQTTLTDPLGHQTITTQNSIGQVTAEFSRDASGRVSANKEFFYDAAGQQIRRQEVVLDAGWPSSSITTEWVYDSMGRLTCLIEAADTPAQKCTRYSYNTKGQKDTVTLADGTALYHSYDPLGRLQRYFTSDHSVDYTYKYDLNGNLLTACDALTQTETKRCYDDQNRMISEKLANGLALAYQYDGLDRPIEILLPDGTGIKYLYDACHLKRVSRVSKRSYEHHYTTYDLSGALLEEVSPAGKFSYQHDLLSRPRAVHAPYFSEIIHDYDAAGNLLSKTRQQHLHKLDFQYGYDSLNQLCSEKMGFETEEYRYDSLHNRRSRNGEKHVISPLNQLLSKGETAYTYDKCGNLIAEDGPRTSTKYSYDALGRLTSLTRDDLRYDYHYDAFNRRIKKSAPKGEERYLYMGQNEIGSANAKGKIVQLRVLGQGKGAEISAATAFELEGEVYLPVYDHCGHVSLLVDLATKKPAAYYYYTAFGEEPYQGFSVANPWRFCSKRLDPESGWIYFGRRYYDPTTGRWTTPDPLGFVDGPNLYAHVNNNPLTHFDLYGLQMAVPPPLGGAACGVAAAGASPVKSGVSHSAAKSNPNKRRVVEFSRDVPERNYAPNKNAPLAAPHLPQVYHFYSYEHCFPRYPRSTIGDLSDLGLPDLPPNLGIGFINGILNNYEDARDSARYISRLAGGYNIQFVHNATHGYFDLHECNLGLKYVATNPVRELHRMWSGFFAKSSAEARFLTICSSQGAIHVRNALLSYPNERRERIFVLAIAPAAYTYKETCAKVYHYRTSAWRDPIPRIDGAGARRARGTVIDLASHPDAPWFDHSFQSPTFEEQLQKRITNYLRSHGESL